MVIRQIFQAALAAADAPAAVRRNLHLAGSTLFIGTERIALMPQSKLIVVGAGKASARMAQAVENILGERITRGLISVKDGHVAPTRTITMREASHPLPDARSLANGRAIIEQVHGLSADDVVLCLLSGGGSALLETLGENLTLEQLRTTTSAVMLGGANIVELNAIRKHLSLIKGGQLARWAQPGHVCSLILSDVVGDDLSAIASGPTSPDPTTFADALDVLQHYTTNATTDEQTALINVRTYLERGARGELPETPKPHDEFFRHVHNVLVGSNRIAIEAAEQQAQQLGYQTELITTFMQGEAREVGKVLAAIARERVAQGAHQLCLLAGGETTVNVRGPGRGGRNQELALALALALAGLEGVTGLCAATDGGDGNSEAAGAMIDASTLARAHAMGWRAARSLDDNDSHHFFAALSDQVITGPTFTNVNDLVIILIA
jgi:glycerate-2-kinase